MRIRRNTPRGLPHRTVPTAGDVPVPQAGFKLSNELTDDAWITYDHADARAVKVTKTGKDEKTTRYISADAEERDGKLVQYVYLGDMRLARFDGKSVEAEAVPAMGAVGARSGGQGAAFGWMLTTLAALMFALFGTRRAAPFPGVRGVRGWRSRRAPALTLALSVLVALSCGGDGDKKGAPKGPPDPVVNLTAEPPPGVPITELPASAVFYAGDYQETPVALTDATGKVTERSSYHPYGAERGHDGTRGELYGYVGNERDGVGLSDFGARPYRAEAGVFLKPDPVAVFDAESLLEEPIRLTAYTYGSGDSITRMDPSGKWFELPLEAASISIGIVSLANNISKKDYGWAAVDAVGLAVDVAGAILPGLPGCMSAGIQMGRVARVADATVDLAKTADKVGDAKKAGGVAGVTEEAGSAGGRFIVDSKGNTLIEPPGGSTVGNKTGTFVETRYPNGSPYQQLHSPRGEAPHRHGFLEGAGPNQRGPSLDVEGNVVPHDSSAAHWPVRE